MREEEKTGELESLFGSNNDTEQSNEEETIEEIVFEANETNIEKAQNPLTKIKFLKPSSSKSFMDIDLPSSSDDVEVRTTEDSWDEILNEEKKNENTKV